MKGIILAGGSGKRLYPITKAISKHILSIYDKPMIYYPLSVLMLAGIRDVLIISTETDLTLYQKLFEDGKQLGLSISYEVQKQPNGLAEAFIIGKYFIGHDNVCLVLGDNIFWGQGFSPVLNQCSKLDKGANIFGYYVQDPRELGVVGFDENMKVTSLEEKPQNPKSNYAIPGLYFYDNTVIKKAMSLKPSVRGELEITDLNRLYMEEGTLKVNLLGRGLAWLDTGTHEGLLEASNFVRAVQKRQGLFIACLEEIAYRKGWITKQQLLDLAVPLMKTHYGEYLYEIAKMDG